jgi:uncharacterized membrane protein YbhN (UPF0104 family)
VLVVVLFWLKALKFQLILKKQDCRVTMPLLFKASCITALYNMITPGMLGVTVKWYILKKDTGKGTNVFSSMVYNQFTDLLVTAVLGLAALMLTNPSAKIIADTGRKWLLPVICGILLNRKVGEKFDGIIRFTLKPLPAKWRQKGFEIIEQIAVFRSAPLKFHFNMLVITTLVAVVGTTILYVIAAKAAGIAVSVLIIIWLSAIIFFLGQLPISIGNLGVREVTLTGLLAIYSVEAPQALLMSMVLFSAVVLMAAIGAIYQMSWSIKSKDQLPANG